MGFWNSPFVPLSGPVPTSAHHAQFADWSLRAGYLFMMRWCQPIHYVMQYRSLHVGSSGAPSFMCRKDGPYWFLAEEDIAKFLVWGLEASEDKSPIVRLEYKKIKSHAVHPYALIWQYGTEEAGKYMSSWVLGFLLKYIANVNSHLSNWSLFG